MTSFKQKKEMKNRKESREKGSETIQRNVHNVQVEYSNVRVASEQIGCVVDSYFQGPKVRNPVPRSLPFSVGYDRKRYDMLC